MQSVFVQGHLIKVCVALKSDDTIKGTKNTTGKPKQEQREQNILFEGAG